MAMPSPTALFDEAFSSAQTAYSHWLEQTLSLAKAGPGLFDFKSMNSLPFAEPWSTAMAMSTQVYEGMLDTQRALMDASAESFRAGAAMSQFDFSPSMFGLTGYFVTAPEVASPAATPAATPAKAKPAPAKAAATKSASGKTTKAKPSTPVASKPKPKAKAKKIDLAETFLKAPKGAADDLTKIKGIGPKLSSALNEIGIFHFDQIASLTTADIAHINERLRFNGRIEREEWIEQAKALKA